MFRTRLISGITLVLIALATITAGKVILAVTLLAVSLVACRELVKACGIEEQGEKRKDLEITVMAVTVLYYFAIALWSLRYAGNGETSVRTVCVIIVIAVCLAFLASMFVYVFTFPKYKAGQVMAAVFSFLYAPLMLSFILLTREAYTEGNYLVWYIFLCSWGSDTCAYAVGVLIGRHKMSPKLSPKKSVEGAVGGILGAALLFALYTYAFNKYIDLPLSPTHAAFLGAVGALVSMIGDLAASAVKRDYGLKDYGRLIPGHGGIMDRFDSVIVASPIIFLGLAWITGSFA